MADSERRLFRIALAIVAAVTLFRILVLMASPLEFYPDEAQYWWWAQTPDLGYFSKPPLIAWAIRLTTLIFGDREWAVRLSMPLFHGGAALLIFASARTAYRGAPPIAFWSALAYLTLPGVSYSSSLASTDAPLLFFWALALLAFLRSLDAATWRWPLLCGAAVGLGLLAKYAMGFFLVSAIAGAAVSPRLRPAVFGRGGLIAATTAFVCIAPNIAWNAVHDFVTLAHTQTNADWSRASFDPVHLAGFLAGQFGVFGPVLMAAWLAALWRIARTPGRDAAEQALCAMSLPPLALIALQAFISDANANWAATAYVAAVPLAIAEIVRRWRAWTLRASFALHAGVLALLWSVQLWPSVAEPLGVGNVFKREEGWRALAGVVKSEAAKGGYPVVATDNRSVTAELLYYMRPDGPPLRIWDPDDASHNHFDMTMRLVPPVPRALLVIAPEGAAEVLATFESARPISTVSLPVGGRHMRTLSLYDARGYRGPVRGD